MATRTRTRTRTIQAAEMPDDLKAHSEETEKLHGPSIVSTGRNLPLANHIPTGCFILDFALLGGIAQGYVSMVYGYHSSGKTLKLLRTIAQFQRKHPTKWAALIDAEGMYDPNWAEINGVDVDRLIVSQPEYGELAVDLYESLLKRESIGLIVVDSIPHMVPNKVIENSAEDDTMAASARLMGKFCSKMTMGNNRERRKGHWVTTILVNQFRSKVGFVLGDPRTLPGGVQLNHVPTTKIELKVKKLHMGKDRYGNEVAEMSENAFKLEKVKHGQSIRSGEYQVWLNPDNEEGMPTGSVDNYPTVVAYGKKMGFITGAGSSWKLITENIEEKVNREVVDFKMKNPDATDRQLEAVRAQANTLTSFPRLDAIKDFLRENPDEYDSLAKSLIAAQRVIKGLPALPPDGYLVSANARLVELDALP